VDYYFPIVFSSLLVSGGLSTREYTFLVFTVVGGGGEGMCFLKVRVIGGGLLAQSVGIEIVEMCSTADCD